MCAISKKVVAYTRRVANAVVVVSWILAVKVRPVTNNRFIIALFSLLYHIHSMHL